MSLKRNDKRSASVPAAPAGTTEVRPWRSIVFAPIGDGQRRRRGSDAIRLIVAGLAVLVAVLMVRANLHPEITIQRVLSPPPVGVRWLVDVFWIFGSFGTIAIVLLLAIVARGWLALRDLVASAAGTLLVSGLLVLALGSDGGRPYSASLRGYSQAFPVLHIAVAVAVAAAALPYLARTVQRFIVLVVGLAVIAAVVAGQALPVNVLGSMAIGWGATAAVHLAFGSPLGLPSGEEVRGLLGTIGLAPGSVVPSTHQTWGAAHYVADMGEGQPPLAISFYGRDAADAQLLTKLWRFVVYRRAGVLPALSRIQQVEHESSITQLAARVGARVPEVLVASLIGPSRDAVLITRAPPARALADFERPDIGDAQLDDLFEQLLELRKAAISHGGLSPRTIGVETDGGWLTISDFHLGTSAASLFTLDQDLAGAMATVALYVGPSRTAASAARVVPAEPLQGALTHLRRAGLDPTITLALKGRSDLLGEVRTSTARAVGIEVPELVEPRRMSVRQILVGVGTLIGGWALILTLINASHSIATIGTAHWSWVVATALLCSASFLGSALSDLGSVPGSLAYGRTVGLEVANSFALLAAGTVSVAATQIRFFQQQGYGTTTAVTAGALVNSVAFVVKTVAFLVALPLAWRTFHFRRALHLGAHGQSLVLIVAAAVAVGLVIAVVAAVPRWRTLVVARLQRDVVVVRTDLRKVRARPSKVVELFGGRLGAQLLLAMALGASLHAFGASLSLAGLIIVLTIAGMVAAAAPTGGGMGFAEAGLILALTAGGVGKENAAAAVFVERLFSAYLPPIAGWVIFTWMRKRDYL